MKKTPVTLLMLMLMLISGCQTIDTTQSASVITQQPLPYHDKLQKRTMDSVDLIVIHSTELPTLVMARAYGEKVHYKSGTGNSGHYYVDRDGAIYQYVADARIANHVRGNNERSIGIEIINNGRYPNWYHWDAQTISEPFTKAQIKSINTLIQRLSKLYPAIQSIASHSDLDTAMMPAENDKSQMIRRKVDPGPLFPWQDVMNKNSLTRLNESL